MRIGIIGYGFVGKATHNMLEKHEVSIYDPGLNYNNFPIHTYAVFICVPTPTIKGRRDHSIVESTLNILEQQEYKGLVIIKSTISPSFVDSFKDYLLDIMVAPEFLNQFEPYAAFEKHLIGVSNIYQATKYREIFGICGYGHKDLRTTNHKTAVMAKNIHNCFGALKVAFFNEVYDVCEDEGIAYREMLACIFAMNDNLDPQYTRVAADGKRGYGGACFPKDSVAMANEYMIGTLRAACDVNYAWRPEEMNKVESENVV
jgi:UDP-glucose 6-dehydrogenase